MSHQVMPHLNQHKYFIYNIYIEENQTVAYTLNQVHLLGIKCSRSTFMLKMKEWSFTKYARSEDTASLRVEIAFLFWKKCLSDVKILRVRTLPRPHQAISY